MADVATIGWPHDLLTLDEWETLDMPDLILTPTMVYEANPSRFTARDVVPVVEITSPGSRRTDGVTKMNEYAEAGIGEYWILYGDALTLSTYALQATVPTD